MNDLDKQIIQIKKDWLVESQFEIAKSLAANCGYQLVAEDSDAQLTAKIGKFADRMKFEGSINAFNTLLNKYGLKLEEND